MCGERGSQKGEHAELKLSGQSPVGGCWSGCKNKTAAPKRTAGCHETGKSCIRIEVYGSHTDRLTPSRSPSWAVFNPVVAAICSLQRSPLSFRPRRWAARQGGRPRAASSGPDHRQAPACETVKHPTTRVLPPECPDSPSATQSRKERYLETCAVHGPWPKRRSAWTSAPTGASPATKAVRVQSGPQPRRSWPTACP